jgi:OmpA-OmpF porin, OOP family
MKHKILLLLMPAFSCLYAQDIPGSADHPMFGRMPGFYITDYSVEEFASEDFVDENGNDRTVEGKKTTIRYECDREEAPLKIVRNYVNAARSLGGKSYEYAGHSAYINIIRGGGETWLNVWASPEVYVLTIVEKGGMVQEITARWMLEELNSSGRVALHIHFATGKSDILPESLPIVEEIVRLLQENPALQLNVDGHTDDVGSGESNKTLSLDRARAVAGALADRGIDTSRLTPQGYGESQPIADNSTEEGRARNRRVELVRR